MDDKSWRKGRIMKTLSEIVLEAEKLKPLPQTAARLAQVIADERSGIDEVSEVIQYDQALVAEVLRIANSSFSATKRAITTIREAVIRLGSGRILEMIISNRVRGEMNTPLVHYGYSEEDLWNHSVASALAAELLNKHIRVNVSGISFTAALLHDIGKLVMVRVLPADDMKKVWARIAESKCSWADAEKQVFNFTHADIGAHIAHVWQLPEKIVQAIRNHHNVNADFDPVTDCVRVANVVARVIGQGIGYEGMSMSVDSEISQRLDLSREHFEILCADTACKFNEIIAQYSQG